jgi:acyl-homoserine lactone acylase PvdQ
MGFAHAEDRLWQMYFGTKVALGEISEVTENIYYLVIWRRCIDN